MTSVKQAIRWSVYGNNFYVSHIILSHHQSRIFDSNEQLCVIMMSVLPSGAFVARIVTCDFF